MTLNQQINVMSKWPFARKRGDTILCSRWAPDKEAKVNLLYEYDNFISLFKALKPNFVYNSKYANVF